MADFILQNAVLPAIAITTFLGVVVLMVLAAAMAWKTVQAIAWWFR